MFAHVPIILGSDGLKLSKRRGAVSVTAYEEAGYLPEAMLNYLARLGWSHGDEELFSREQMVAWFDGGHLSKSPAQWDRGQARLGQRALPEGARRAGAARARRGRSWRGAASSAGDDARSCARCAVFKDRCSTGAELADWLAAVFADVTPSAEDRAAHVDRGRAPGARRSSPTSSATVEWNKAAIAAAIKETLAAHGLKMPQLAPAVRVLVCGRAQTPSLDAVLEVFERETVLRRLRLSSHRRGRRARWL